MFTMIKLAHTHTFLLLPDASYPRSHPCYSQMPHTFFHILATPSCLIPSFTSLLLPGASYLLSHLCCSQISHTLFLIFVLSFSALIQETNFLSISIEKDSAWLKLFSFMFSLYVSNIWVLNTCFFPFLCISYRPVLCFSSM